MTISEFEKQLSQTPHGKQTLRNMQLAYKIHNTDNSILGVDANDEESIAFTDTLKMINEHQSAFYTELYEQELKRLKKFDYKVFVISFISTIISTAIGLGVGYFIWNQ